MRGTPFALAIGLAAMLVFGGCGSTGDTRRSGGGESVGWDSVARSLRGQNAPSGPDDDIPIIEWDEKIDRPVQPPPPPVPPTEVVKPIEPVKPANTGPKPLPAPLKPAEVEEAIEYPMPESHEDGAALAYDQLKRAARSKGDDGARFVPVTRKMSNGIEGLTQYYKRVIQKLNPGF